MFCLCGQLPVAYFNSINNNNNNKNNSGNKPHIKTLSPKINTHKVPSCIQFSRVTYSRNSFMVSYKIYSLVWHPVTRYIHTDLMANRWSLLRSDVSGETLRNITDVRIQFQWFLVKNKILLTYLQMFHNPAALGQ